MKNIDVSVIVLTYKPNWDKLKNTLLSVVRQKDINYEIIVSDDGSQQDYRKEIEAFLTDSGITEYVYNKNEQNVGTVKNYLSGLYKAKGRYVFGISPGDMFFDDATLKDMVAFCDEKQVGICFGNAVYYHAEEGCPKVFSGVNTPKRPRFYDEKTSFSVMKRMFFNGENILGVTYLKDRECALECFERISKHAMYLEDKCSTAVALVKGYRVVHYDRNIVWYEKGTGISTSGNGEWAKKLSNDYNRVIVSLKEEYPKDEVIDAVYIRKTCTSKPKKLLVMLFRHPLYFFFRVYRKFIKITYTESSEKLQKQLEDTLRMEGK